MLHELKISPKYFADVDSLKKKAEIRFNDRDFKVGDLVTLREFEDGRFTGKETGKFVITHVLSFEGLKDGYVSISLEPLFSY